MVDPYILLQLFSLIGIKEECQKKETNRNEVAEVRE